MSCVACAEEVVRRGEVSVSSGRVEGILDEVDERNRERMAREVWDERRARVWRVRWDLRVDTAEC
jgi:hypothetical protein